MLPAYILFLREGLEASMIVSILLAAVTKLGRPREQVRAIWGGMALAIVVAAAGGTALFLTLRDYDGTTFQTVVETFAYLVAVVLLTTMTFWMQHHSRSLKQELTARAAAGGSAIALGLLTFTSVGREALESAVFMLAFAFKSNGWLLLTGGVLGALTAVVLAVAIYKMGARMDYRRFFQVMGLLLLLFAAGLLGDAVQNMQTLGWLNIGTTHLWSTARWLSEDSWLGDLLHSFIGYAQSPTALQAFAYFGFLAVAGGFFYRMTRLPHRPTAAPAKSAGSVGLGANSPVTPA
jgi:high-affinity iron transporter